MDTLHWLIWWISIPLIIVNVFLIIPDYTTQRRNIMPYTVTNGQGRHLRNFCRSQRPTELCLRGNHRTPWFWVQWSNRILQSPLDWVMGSPISNPPRKGGLFFFFREIGHSPEVDSWFKLVWSKPQKTNSNNRFQSKFCKSRYCNFKWKSGNWKSYTYFWVLKKPQTPAVFFVVSTQPQQLPHPNWDSKPHPLQ